ncbi:MAG TPA: hypothetical protein VER03_25980, partial [Bryobacteraceae bacterium]|nr:hypothetical protein [Bryobacteraceae bacterium]
EGSADLIVRAGNAMSIGVATRVLPVQPGIFFNTATNEGAITIAGSGQLTSDNPPAAGEYISIYATGLGSVQPGASGLDETVIPAEVWIGGARAEVLYSGRAPGFVGLYQLNARVPAQTAPGTNAVSVVLGGVRSNEVRIRVR